MKININNKSFSFVGLFLVMIVAFWLINFMFYSTINLQKKIKDYKQQTNVKYIPPISYQEEDECYYLANPHDVLLTRFMLREWVWICNRK